MNRKQQIGTEEAAAASSSTEETGGGQPDLEVGYGIHLSAYAGARIDVSYYGDPIGTAANSTSSKKEKSDKSNANMQEKAVDALGDRSLDNPVDDDLGEPDQKTKPQQTKESKLMAKLGSIKINQKISGDELKKYIPDLKGVDYITKVSNTKFSIESTFLGSALISDGAYLEIKPNSSIQGIGSKSGNNISTRGISIRMFGVSKTASINVAGHSTQSFVIVGNDGMFKVGNKIFVFGL